MGVGKGLLTVKLLILAVLFWSLISVILNLEGAFFTFEVILLACLFLIAIVSLMGTGSSWGWKGFVVFYCINFINILAVYFSRFGLKEMILPFIAALIGYAISLSKSDDVKFEKEQKEDAPKIEVVKEEKTPEKKAAKKKAKKKKANK